MTYLPPVSRSLFLTDIAVPGIAGYTQLVKPPLTPDTEVCVNAATTGAAVLIASFMSAAMGISEVPAGDWIHSVFGYVDTVDGVSEIEIRVYKRSSSGVETLLYTTTTGGLTASPAEYTITDSNTLFSLSVTDRLVIKYYAKTTSGSARTVYLYYLGEARQTRVFLPVELTIVPGGDMRTDLYDSDLDGVVSSGGGHTIQDEGSPVTQRTNLNFIGTAVAVTDNPANDATDVIVTASGGAAPDSYSMVARRHFR